MSALLRIEKIRKDFTTGGRVVRALDGVSLEAGAGEALGIVGESGCGKSTLARCAVCLLKPSSGRVWFDGMELPSMPAAELRHRRREFQIILQDAPGSLDPRMTVGRIVMEPMQAHRLGTPRERRERLRALLGEVGLEPAVEERFPSDLSGGEQQRVAVARALALEPRLLVADEPVSALDVSVQAQLLNLLDEIRRRRGLTLLLISHDLPVVRYACGRTLVMYLGRVVEERRTEDLFRDPLHPYSRLLLDSIPARNAARSREAVSGGGAAEKSAPGGCAFYPRCPRALPRCALAVPPLQARSDGDSVACFLYT